MPDKGKPLTVAANSAVDFDSSQVVGFLCTTSGSLALRKLDQNGATVIVSTFPVTAGQWVDIPIIIDSRRGRATTTSGGAGVLVIR